MIAAPVPGLVEKEGQRVRLASVGKKKGQSRAQARGESRERCRLMSIYLVLDLLLILLIALFAPIGYWRGPVKELLVTFGVLFGILLADFWARPWGRDLADITAIGSSGGAFVVAMAFMVTVTFILGYGAGAAIAPTDFSPIARAVGAGIALFNGALLVAFSLQYVRVYLLSPATEEALYDSFIVQFLLDQIGWVLLAVAIVGWPLLLAILITGRRAYEDHGDFVDYDYGPADDVDYEDEYVDEQPTRVAYERSSAPADARVYPPRVPVSHQDDSSHVYKAEPTSSSSRPTDATRPIQVSDRWDSPEATRPGDEDATSVNEHTDPDMAVVKPVETPDQTGDEPEATPNADQPSGADDNLAPGYSRCVNCHAVLAPDARVCPVCGEVN